MSKYQETLLNNDNFPSLEEKVITKRFSLSYREEHNQTSILFIFSTSFKDSIN
jgi:hypothetical protein